MQVNAGQCEYWDAMSGGMGSMGSLRGGVGVEDSSGGKGCGAAVGTVTGAVSTTTGLVSAVTGAGWTAERVRPSS